MSNIKTTRPKRTCFVIILIPLTLLIVLIAAGVTYESLASANSFRQHPPPGQLYDVGGYRLHLHIMGEDRGLPAVILDHGALSMSSQWGWVMPEIARHTRVVAYDRPGMGWSDPSPRQLEADELVRHLHYALQNAGIPGPYILVGHSMGGLTTRLFAQAYPEDVAGLVQVDPRDLIWHGPAASEMQLQSALIKTISRLGIPRLTGMAERDTEGLPSPFYEQAVAISPSYRQLGNIDHEGYLGDSAATILLLGENLDRFPLIVLSAAEPDGAIPSPQREEVNAQHSRLAAQSSQGEHRFIHGAGHITIVTQSEHAQQINAAILDLLISQEN
jgi:pimeloyl-ACP methyl ester carboxylesterase